MRLDAADRRNFRRGGVSDRTEPMRSEARAAVPCEQDPPALHASPGCARPQAENSEPACASKTQKSARTASRSTGRRVGGRALQAGQVILEPERGSSYTRTASNHPSPRSSPSSVTGISPRAPAMISPSSEARELRKLPWQASLSSGGPLPTPRPDAPVWPPRRPSPEPMPTP